MTSHVAADSSPDTIHLASNHPSLKHLTALLSSCVITGILNCYFTLSLGDKAKLYVAALKWSQSFPLVLTTCLCRPLLHDLCWLFKQNGTLWDSGTKDKKMLTIQEKTKQHSFKESRQGFGLRTSSSHTQEETVYSAIHRSEVPSRWALPLEWQWQHLAAL